LNWKPALWHTCSLQSAASAGESAAAAGVKSGACHQKQKWILEHDRELTQWTAPSRSAGVARRAGTKTLSEILFKHGL